MSFGIAILVLVMLCSLAGSLVPQDRAEAWYVQNYPKAGTLILKLGINNLFQSQCQQVKKEETTNYMNYNE